MNPRKHHLHHPIRLEFFRCHSLLDSFRAIVLSSLILVAPGSTFATRQPYVCFICYSRLDTPSTRSPHCPFLTRANEKPMQIMCSLTRSLTAIDFKVSLVGASSVCQLTADYTERPRCTTPPWTIWGLRLFTLLRPVYPGFACVCAWKIIKL